MGRTRVKDVESPVQELELVERSRQGDGKAFEALVRKYASRVASLAFAKLGSFADGEEVLQEVFFRAWKNLSTLRDGRKFAAWLAGITHWVCMELRRERKPVSLNGSQELQASLSAFASPPHPESQEIWELLEQLPEHYREVLLLFYVENCSYEEIRQVTGLTKAGVAFRLSQGRKLLAQLLERKGWSHDGV